MSVTTNSTGEREWTPEQAEAIARRGGELLLDASAGSGKTSVLVERFVASVLEDGLDVSAILTITFTEKAAAEMRERIRLRLRELGAMDAARDTEGAVISTIHGFCAGLLRAHALNAGIDPHFQVLDAWQAQRLADGAFDEALEDLGQQEPGGLELIAAHGVPTLRAATLATYGELRSRGERDPRLPPLGPAPDLEAARGRLQAAITAAARELGEIASPPARVLEALGRLESCSELVVAGEPWPGAIAARALPGGNGAALSTPTCVEYAAALQEFRVACEHRWAVRAHRLLDLLLGGFGARYARQKRDASGVDFEDLELMALGLLRTDPELRERLRKRFARIMVDELQDTNQVQLDLIEELTDDNLFTVGDAQQSIYGFRHADVGLFEARGLRLQEVGARVTLQTNFRSRPEILTVLNRLFADQFPERFRALQAGRQTPAAGTAPLVELLIADKGAEWEYEGLSSPWRVAEARALAGRLSEFVAGGVPPADVVVLFRAATDMRVYERALEERGVPTYVVGGRGYWTHPQVVDMVAYLRALANPRDLEALYTVLASPLVAVSLDTLVILAAAARAADRDPWWVMSEPEDRLDELEFSERERLARFAAWFAEERRASARLGVAELIDRCLEQTAYDDAVLAMPGGQRRLANLRKLMRLGQEQATASGDPLREFLALVRFRSAPWSVGDASESEAPVEGEGLDAVRMMTIHRAKGLEFEVVCLADLGRGPRGRSELMRIGRDGRFGLRLGQPGTGRSEPALEYRALGEEQLEAGAREEQRLMYVAMTRARERLILSGAAKLEAWPTGPGGGPISWIGPGLVPDLASRAERCEDGVEDGVAIRFMSSEEGAGPTAPPTGVALPDPDQELVLIGSLPAPPAAAPSAAVTELSYSSLEEYRRCGYRFYVERVLGVPAADVAGVPATDVAGLPPSELAGDPEEPPATAQMGALERGILVHALLEGLDFRRPVLPKEPAISSAAGRTLVQEEAREIAALLEAFTTSELCVRLGRATTVRAEQPFSFLLGGRPERAESHRASPLLIRGVFDVIAYEPGGRTLVVDYKTDRLQDPEPESVVQSSYALQRLIYALAALRAGAREVDVVHMFLERPGDPAVARFEQADLAGLEAELIRLSAAVVSGEFPVSPAPHRGLCQGCPAEGGLCSWPLTETRRAAADRLF